MSTTKFTLEEVKQEFIKLNYIPLFNEYINNHEPLKYQCLKHPDIEQTIWFKDLRRGNRCYFCSKEKTDSQKRIPIESIKQEIIDRGFIPLFNTYKNNRDKLLVQTKEGYKFLVFMSSFKDGHAPCIFSKINPYIIDNINLFCELENRSFKLISKTYKTMKTKLKWQCLNEKCGIIFDMDLDHILRGQKCPECNTSNGEEVIRKYLIRNNINYQKEYRFNDCRYKNPLPFDFYLPNFNICIEYDGEGHYISKDFFGGDNQFKLIQLRDQIKTNYCLVNNISLLRIPYWEFKNIEQILDNFLSNFNQTEIKQETVINF